VVATSAHLVHEVESVGQNHAAAGFDRDRVVGPQRQRWAMRQDHLGAVGRIEVGDRDVPILQPDPAMLGGDVSVGVLDLEQIRHGPYRAGDDVGIAPENDPPVQQDGPTRPQLQHPERWAYHFEWLLGLVQPDPADPAVSRVRR